MEHSLNATHVVLEIQWGANAIFTLSSANDEGCPAKEIQDEINAELNRLKTAEQNANVETKCGILSKQRSLMLKVFADVLPIGYSELRIIEEALTYIVDMKNFARETGDRRSTPTRYTLIPLSFFLTNIRIVKKCQ